MAATVDHTAELERIDDLVLDVGSVLRGMAPSVAHTAIITLTVALAEVASELGAIPDLDAAEMLLVDQLGGG